MMEAVISPARSARATLCEALSVAVRLQRTMSMMEQLSDETEDRWKEWESWTPTESHTRDRSGDIHLYSGLLDVKVIVSWHSLQLSVGLLSMSCVPLIISA